VGAIISVRELSAKRWKGFQRGGVWGTLLRRYGTPQFSRGGASPEPIPRGIAQGNDSPATGGSQET
jgi:hypothetical protein